MIRSTLTRVYSAIKQISTHHKDEKDPDLYEPNPALTQFLREQELDPGVNYNNFNTGSYNRKKAQDQAGTQSMSNSLRVDTNQTSRKSNILNKIPTPKFGMRRRSKRTRNREKDATPALPDKWQMEVRARKNMQRDYLIHDYCMLFKKDESEKKKIKNNSKFTRSHLAQEIVNYQQEQEIVEHQKQQLESSNAEGAALSSPRPAPVPNLPSKPAEHCFFSPLPPGKSCEERLEETQRRLHELQDAYEASEEKSKKLEGDLASKTQEAQSLKEKVKILENLERDRKDAMAAEAAKEQEMQKKFNDLEAECNVIYERYSQSKVLNDWLNTDIESKSKEVKRLKTELVVAKKASKANKEEMMSVKEICESNQIENNKLLAEYRRQEDESLAEIAELRSSKERLKTELEDVEAAYDQLAKTTETQAKTTETQAKVCRNLKSQVERLKGKANKTGLAQAKMKSKLQDLDNPAANVGPETAGGDVAGGRPAAIPGPQRHAVDDFHFDCEVGSPSSSVHSNSEANDNSAESSDDDHFDCEAGSTSSSVHSNPEDNSAKENDFELSDNFAKDLVDSDAEANKPIQQHDRPGFVQLTVRRERTKVHTHLYARSSQNPPSDLVSAWNKGIKIAFMCNLSEKCEEDKKVIFLDPYMLYLWDAGKDTGNRNSFLDSNNEPLSAEKLANGGRVFAEENFNYIDELLKSLQCISVKKGPRSAPYNVKTCANKSIQALKKHGPECNCIVKKRNEKIKQEARARSRSAVSNSK